MTYTERLQKFQALLGAAADLAYFPVSSSDLQYLTGIPRDIPNYGATIHPGAWLEGAWFAPDHTPVFTVPRMSAEFDGLEKIQGIEQRVLGDWDDPEKLVADVLKGFKLPPKPRVAVSNWSRGETIVHLQHLLPDAVFISGTDILRELRVIKTEDDIAVMREAGRITEAAFADVLSKLRIGMTELEIITEVDFQMRRHGSLGPTFTTSLYTTGPNHPRITGDREKKWHRQVGTGVSVLFDFGAEHDGWCYDYGRTVSFGEPTAEQIRVHRVIMDSQAAGIAALKAGEVTCEQVDAVARKVVEDSGYGPAFRHRLGHGIGMDVHEPPFLTRTSTVPVREGMLFTIEPSIMQDTGASARIEDIIVARPGGGEALTTGWPDLIVVS